MKRNAAISFLPEGESIDFADDKGGYYAAEDGDRSVYFRPDLPEGAAEWGYTADGVLAGLSFICPCGCKAVVGLLIDHGGWTFQGARDLARPTLASSILRVSGCRWHGHLRAGVFEEC